MGRRPKQTFLQKNIQMANKYTHTHKCSTSIVISKMQIKPGGMTSHLSEWPSFKNPQTIGLPRQHSGKESSVNTGDVKDPLEEEMATHSSILASEIPGTEEPGGLRPKGLQRVGQD